MLEKLGVDPKGATAGGILTGGLGELLDRFKQNGQGDKAEFLGKHRRKQAVYAGRAGKSARARRTSMRSRSTPTCRRTNCSRGFAKNCLQRSINTRRKAASPAKRKREISMSILWTIIIGFVAGVIAKFIMPGDNEPSGSS